MTSQPDGTSSRPQTPASEPLVLGYVAGSHGVAGAIRVHLHDPDSDALAPGRTLGLRRDGAVVLDAEIASVGGVPGKPQRRRITLVGVGDRDRAESLRGCEVTIARDELPPLADDEFYLADAVGLPVQREHEGATQALGTVVGVTSNGVQDLFEVQWRGPKGRAHTWLLPVLPHTVLAVDEARVLCAVPLGMLPEALEATEHEPAAADEVDEVDEGDG